MKFCSGGEKMRNASGYRGENERQWKKSEQEHVRHFLHKTCNQEVSGSFMLLVVQNKLLIRPTVVFHQSRFPPLSIIIYFV